MTTNIKFFHFEMQGAPQIDIAQGDFYNMIKACLVTGFNLKTVDSISRVGAVATASVSTGHGYEIGQWVLHAGAAQAEYNGEVQVITKTTNQYTFAVTGTPVTPATTTTTITAKVAPLGFEEVFSAPYKGVFRSKNVLGPRNYLRCDNADPGTEYVAGRGRVMKVSIAENMSDVDTFVGYHTPFRADDPTRGERGYGWIKWHQARAPYSQTLSEATAIPAGPRKWRLVGDDRGFFLFHGASPWAGSGYHHWAQQGAFQEFTSFKVGDPYNTVLWGQESQGDAYSGQVSPPYYQSPQGNGQHFTGSKTLRDYTGLNDTRLAMCTLSTGSAALSSGTDMGIGFPNGVDFSAIIHPTYLREETAVLRGILPGYYFIHNNWAGAQDRQILDNVAGYPGRTFVIISVGYGDAEPYKVALDLTGPWH